jgi:hypothetical protein
MITVTRHKIRNEPAMTTFSHSIVLFIVIVRKNSLRLYLREGFAVHVPEVKTHGQIAFIVTLNENDYEYQLQGVQKMFPERQTYT